MTVRSILILLHYGSVLPWALLHFNSCSHVRVQIAVLLSFWIAFLVWLENLLFFVVEIKNIGASTKSGNAGRLLDKLLLVGDVIQIILIRRLITCYTKITTPGWTKMQRHIPTEGRPGEGIPVDAYFPPYRSLCWHGGNRIISEQRLAWWKPHQERKWTWGLSSTLVSSMILLVVKHYIYMTKRTSRIPWNGHHGTYTRSTTRTGLKCFNT